MSLGSIAHLQHHFARTGLLDGKGAQLAKSRESSGPGGAQVAIFGLDDPVDGEELVSGWDYQEPMMLAPTVSTYNDRPTYVPPPPDMAFLRKELREALEDARRALKEAEGEDDESSAFSGSPPAQPSDETSTRRGWYQIQGLRILDLVTLAIRAAKSYYAAHERPQRLYSIKPERQLRSELHHILDTLKRVATRNFAGGIRPVERDSMLSWTASIDGLWRTDEAKEKTEQEERERWGWLEGDWIGKERERGLLFLRSLDPNPGSLPVWTEPSTELPTPFLKTMQSGLRLVELHNELVRESKRQFGEIKAYHTDTAKPYRRAENLRYWIKAAELRWELKLDVDVMSVVQGTDDAAWRKFDEAVLQWCKGVREEITTEWDREQRKASSISPPML